MGRTKKNIKLKITKNFCKINGYRERIPKSIGAFESELFNHLSTSPYNAYSLAETAEKSNQIQQNGHNLRAFP